MGEIDKNATRYRTMAVRGVTTGSLESVSYSKGTWRLQFRKNASLSRDEAKAIAIDFMEMELDAKDIKFYGSRVQPETIFTALFMTDAL